MLGPSTAEAGTPPRQMISSQHARRAAAHQAAADGDFTVQVSNAKASLGLGVPAVDVADEADGMWGELQLVDDDSSEVGGQAGGLGE